MPFVPISPNPPRSDFWLPSMTENGTACFSVPYSLSQPRPFFCPTTQCRTFSSAPILIPRPVLYIAVLVPSLYFNDLLPPRVLLLPPPSAHPHAFRPKERGHGGQLLNSFLPVASAICRLTYFLSVREMPPVLSTCSQGPRPSSTASSLLM